MCVKFTQTKNGLSAVVLPLDEVRRPLRHVVVDGFHPLLGERTGVFDDLLANSTETRIDGRIVPVAGLAVHHAARTVLGAKRRVLRVVGKLRLLFGVQVIQVAVELVESVNRRQELVAVAKMVLAELAGRVTERLEQLGDRRIFLLQAQRRAGQAHLGETRPQAMLAGEERCSAGRATLLGIVVGEDHPFVWRRGRCSACGNPSRPSSRR